MTSTVRATDWNQAVIEEFRANDGRVGGPWVGRHLLLLHSVGARTGIERVSPLAFQELTNGFAVFASKGGADTNPGWYHNLLANPLTTIEVGAVEVEVQASEATGETYDRIWSKQKATMPAFAEYERRTSRPRIPVMILQRT